MVMALRPRERKLNQAAGELSQGQINRVIQ